MSNDKQRIVAEFDKCPNCGSTRRFAGEVAGREGGNGAGFKVRITANRWTNTRP